MLPALMPKPTSLEEQVVLVLVFYSSCLLFQQKIHTCVKENQYKFLKKKRMHCTLKVIKRKDHICYIGFHCKFAFLIITQAWSHVV